MSLPPVVILAAGESSRFWPLSTHGHKSLHRLVGESIIEHTVRSLAAAGFDDVVVVESEPSHDTFRLPSGQLGDGSRYGVRLRYATQQDKNGPGGAILAAAEMLEGSFYAVQPENINAGEILAELEALPAPVAATAQQRHDTWQFGVFDAPDGTLATVVEKPARGAEPSRFCNMAVYKLDQRYLQLLRELPGHSYSSIQALQARATNGDVAVHSTELPFFPLKYPWDLFAMRDHLHGSAGRPYIGANVTIGAEAEVASDCVIEQDCVIGDGVRVSNCLIAAGSELHSSLSDSICGAAVQIGRNVSQQTASTSTIKVMVKGEMVDTNLSALGIVAGQGVRIGNDVQLGSGIMLGSDAEVSPGSSVEQNLGSLE